MVRGTRKFEGGWCQERASGPRTWDKARVGKIYLPQEKTKDWRMEGEELMGDGCVVGRYGCDGRRGWWLRGGGGTEMLIARNTQEKAND